MSKKKLPTNPFELRKELRKRESAERKKQQTGLTHANCKGCGLLPIENFDILYVRRSGKYVWIPRNYCKDCGKIFVPSLGKEKREEYAATQKARNARNYEENGDNVKAYVRGQQQKSRSELSDSYIRKLIRRQTGINKKYITSEMIESKRKDIIDRRKRVEKNATWGPHNKKWRLNWIRSQIKDLGKSYIKKLIRRGGYKGDISDAMIEERRNQVLADREKRGKCGTAVQQLSDNYVLHCIHKSDKIPLLKITKEMIEERRKQIIEKRIKYGIVPKDRKKKVKTSKTTTTNQNT